MRRAISILLLALLSFPAVAAFLTSERADASSVPICCRNNGKHHCLLNGTMAGSPTLAGMQFRAPVERCPYFPRALRTAHADAMSLFVPAHQVGALVAAPASVAQTESKWRIARDRSRQKRGPPFLLD